MAKRMIYDTELRVDAPLLIGRRALDNLHNTIERTYEKISKANDEALENEVERFFQDRSSYYKNKSSSEIEETNKKIRQEKSERYKMCRTITVNLGDNKSFSAESVKELVSSPELARENIKDLRIQYGSDKASVVSMEFSSTLSSCLLIRVSPIGNELSEEIFAELRDWADQNQAPLWQRLWTKIKGWHWMIFFLIFMFSFQFIQSHQDIALENHKIEAHRLLSNGITKDTIPQAVDLILRIQSEYTPEPLKQKEQSFSRRFSVFLIGFLLIAIILSILPTLVIGIGKGGAKIIYWKWWLRLVSITMPTLIFTSILWPKIIIFITKLF